MHRVATELKSNSKKENPCTQSAPPMTLGSEVALRAQGFGNLRSFPIGHAGKEVFRALIHFIEKQSWINGSKTAIGSRHSAVG
jgi:hypothetical protein